MTGKEILKYRANQDTMRYRVKLNGKWVVIGAPIVKGAEMQTMGRLSGQVDKNKNLIWEGDICSVDIINEFGSVSPGLGVMVFSEERTAFVFELVYDTTEKLDVQVKNVLIIGNIIDNPELLCPKNQT